MLLFHIIGGGLVLLCGFIALCASKGLNLHKLSGNIFYIAMVILSLSAAYLEYQLGDIPIMGILSLYFAYTSWITIKRQEQQVGKLEYVGFLIITTIAITFYKWGWDIVYNGKVLEGTLPIEGYFIFGSFAAFAAILDLTMLIQGGVAGAHRIARHLWRMCIAFLMAILSFLDQDIFPESITNTGLLWLPVTLLVLMMIYWLCRLPYSQWRKV
ncbi:MAG: putative membrane protein [Paraglaciecola sp.]|jgi:uncharacterized membrane protein